MKTLKYKAAGGQVNSSKGGGPWGVRRKLDFHLLRRGLFSPRSSQYHGKRQGFFLGITQAAVNLTTRRRTCRWIGYFASKAHTSNNCETLEAYERSACDTQSKWLSTSVQPGLSLKQVTRDRKSSMNKLQLRREFAFSACLPLPIAFSWFVRF